jgi:competence protein ComEA
LKRIYSFSEIDYLRLEKYINIADNQQFTNYNNSPSNINELKKSKIDNANIKIDVNKANVEEWLELRGIGRTFATRIVEQREKLGGFASFEQIRLIHGIPDSTYRNILPHLLTSSPIYRKISINKITIDNFMHPYLTRKQVEILMRYRVNHGDFKKIEDLKKTGVFTDDLLEKLKPYIIFD